jgi:hypothetical protein
MNKLLKLFAAAALFLSLAAADASAQQWQMLASFPGRPASSIIATTDLFDWLNIMDFNGDGVADKPMIAVDPSDPSGNMLYIQSGADPTKTYKVSIDLGPYNYRLIGFFNFDGTVNSDNPKEILIAQKLDQRYTNPVVIHSVIQDGVITESEYFTFGTNVVLASVTDLIIDPFNGFVVVIFDVAMREVQMWGIR